MITYSNVPSDARTWETHCAAERAYDRAKELCDRLNTMLRDHGVHNSSAHGEVTVAGVGHFREVAVSSQVALNLTIGDAALLFEVLRDARRKEPYR